MKRDLWIFAGIAVLVLALIGSCAVLTQSFQRSLFGHLPGTPRAGTQDAA